MKNYDIFSIFLLSEGSLYIKLGAHNRYSTTEGAVVSGVSTIIRHPSYNSRIISYDYALVELDQSITFTDKVVIPVTVLFRFLLATSHIQSATLWPLYFASTPNVPNHKSLNP